MPHGNANIGRVNLTKYVRVGSDNSGKWRFCPVARAGNGRVRPDHVLVDGRPELHKEGAYYIEWYVDGKRHRESVGKNPTEAWAAAERKVQVLRNEKLGIEVVDTDQHDRTTLAEACYSICVDVEALMEISDI